MGGGKGQMNLEKGEDRQSTVISTDTFRELSGTLAALEVRSSI